MAANFRSPARILRRLKLLPLVIRKVRNWPSFIYNYALGLCTTGPYVFRQGGKVQIGRALDHVPLIEIFLREEYGRVADGSVLLDLGANIGAFSVYAAARARDVRVYAYEPLPEFFAQLQRNVRLNGIEDRVHCFQSAVSADVEARILHVSSPGVYFPTLVAPTASPAQDARPVPCTTLTEIMETNALERVDLMKMDCEGSEYDILYSTPASVLQNIGEIRMEYHNLDADRRNVRELKAYLREAGFRITSEAASSSTNGTIWAAGPGSGA